MVDKLPVPQLVKPPDFNHQQYSSWWFQTLFSTLVGEMIQFDEHIFQRGWFNHQLGIAVSFREGTQSSLIWHRSLHSEDGKRGGKSSWGIFDQLVNEMMEFLPRLAGLKTCFLSRQRLLKSRDLYTNNFLKNVSKPQTHTNVQLFSFSRFLKMS